MLEINIIFSDKYEDIAAIHDGLYSYNLSKTGKKSIEVHAERFPEQAAWLVRDVDGHFLGGIAYHWENSPRKIFIDYFFLKETCRGCGFGKKLFELLFQTAENGDAEKIELTTDTFQAPDFYRKLGFTYMREEKAPQPACPDNIHYYFCKTVRKINEKGALVTTVKT